MPLKLKFLKYSVLIFFLLLLGFMANAQADTVATVNDSLVANIDMNAQSPLDTLYQKLLDNPYLQPSGPPVYLVIKEKAHFAKDEIFYLLAGLLLLLAFIRSVFSRYFQSIFQVLFQPSIKQKQTREQLTQTSLPAFLLNIFFIISGGIYLVFLLKYYNVGFPNFWIGLFFSTLFLLILYLGKYIFLSFAGWVFQAGQITDNYIYIVNLLNKILGVLLVPFIFLFAYAKPSIVDFSLTISLLLIFILFAYRYISAIKLVRRDVKLSALHFFLYIIAIEFIPLLLIYKSLSLYLDITL